MRATLAPRSKRPEAIDEGHRPQPVPAASPEPAPLDEREIVTYLIEGGLLDARAAVRDRVTVVDQSRRNLNYLVKVDEDGYFVKQGVGRERRSTIGAEATTHRLLKRSARLDKYMVPLRRFDSARAIEVFDLVPSASSWRDHFVRTRRLPLMFARRAGRALAGLHSLSVPPVLPVELRRGPAEILSIHRPPAAILDSTSRAGLRVAAMVQAAQGLGDALEAAASNWRFEAVIHGDIRWDNCLVFPGSTAHRATRLKLIDWELARVGDPAWDVGCVFAEYLGSWLTSIPSSPDLPPDKALDQATVPLERVQPSLHLFWDFYVKSLDSPRDMTELLLRATRFAGARLIQSGFERADRRAQVSTSSVVLIQLGFNMLVRPRAAVTHLLGLTDT